MLQRAQVPKLRRNRTCKRESKEEFTGRKPDCSRLLEHLLTHALWQLMHTIIQNSKEIYAVQSPGLTILLVLAEVEPRQAADIYKLRWDVSCKNAGERSAGVDSRFSISVGLVPTRRGWTWVGQNLRKSMI